ncbi:Cof-type HAD-IIB family hydrolase [Phycisphaeraceae bacterium D3-23]
MRSRAPKRRATIRPEDDFDFDDWPDETPAPAQTPGAAAGSTQASADDDDDLAALDDLFPGEGSASAVPADAPIGIDPRFHIDLPTQGVSDSVFPYGVAAGIDYATGKPAQREPEPQAPKPVLPVGPPRFDLIALDLDGTLMRTDKKVAMFDVNAIKRAIQRGVKVVIATARPPRSSREIYLELGLDTPLINYNGALIHDPRPRNGAHGKHLVHQPLASSLARAMVECARAIDPGVVVTMEILDKCYTDHDDPTLQTETAKKFKPDYIGSLEVPLKHDITKLMFLAPGDRLKQVRKAIAEQFRGQAAFMESDEHVMQIAHQSVGKERALAWVAKSLGIPAEKCFAMGDAPNDAGMLRWAGKGIAVANAFGDARAAADVILKEGNDNEAVGHAIEDYVL